MQWRPLADEYPRPDGDADADQHASADEYSWRPNEHPDLYAYADQYPGGYCDARRLDGHACPGHLDHGRQRESRFGLQSRWKRLLALQDRRSKRKSGQWGDHQPPHHEGRRSEERRVGKEGRLWW